MLNWPHDFGPMAWQHSLTEVYSSAKPSASGLAAKESEKGLGPYTLHCFKGIGLPTSKKDPPLQNSSTL